VDVLLQKALPLVVAGTAINSFIHVQDPAVATLAVVLGEPGVYNIVDDDPVSAAEWLPAFAHFVGPPAPVRISKEEALTMMAPDAVKGAMRVSKLKTSQDVTCAFARLALGTAFLSAVADRFGLWGPHGAPSVAWGDMAHFLAYTRHLTLLFSYRVSLILAWTATVAEVLLGLSLLIGYRVRTTSAISGFLLIAFGAAMAFSTGPKSPLDASVFSAAAASLLLSFHEPDRFTLDARRELTP
jgi:uncharacterized membrane protein YphA (DoxX/SURF4 family)